MSEAYAYDEPAPVLHDQPPHAMLWHEYANLFPMLEGQAFWDLVADVREHGVREPIVMFEGKVLDGRNRYMAAREVGARIPLIDYDGPDALAYVVSLNLKRRHLTEGQRAMVASKLAKMPKGARTDLAPIEAMSQPKAADLMNVSRTAVQRATVVRDFGTPALVASVEAGEVSVSAAAEVARLPEIVQAAVVEEGPQAVRELAADLRAATPDEKLELRRQAVDMAEKGLRRAPAPKADRRNPDYQDDPAFKAMSAVAAACQSITDKIGFGGTELILRGFLDPGMKERNIPTFRNARDALNKLLEACGAE